MVKSAAPVFVLLFAFLFRLETPTFKLLAIITLICLGVFLMVQNESHFSPLGYVQVQLATVFSGLRWSLTQVLLEHKALGSHNPLATTFFLSPVMGVALLVACVAVEGGVGPLSPAPNPTDLPHLQTVGMTLFTALFILGGGVISFLMVYAEYRVICETSVVSFSVAGILKEILILLGRACVCVCVCWSLCACIDPMHTLHTHAHTGAGLVFGDEWFTVQKLAGLAISLVGIGLYNYTRLERSKARTWRLAEDAFFPADSAWALEEALESGEEEGEGEEYDFSAAAARATLPRL
jgi:drug/metabolite transporter (DMT)-like permease